MAERDGVAGERLRVEARPSTVSLVRRAGSYVVNVLFELFDLPGPFRWPRTDVVVIDVLTGRTLRTWHEAGDAGPALVSVLNEELAEMSYGEFAEKWDLPRGRTRRAGPGRRRRRGRRHRGGRDATRARRAGPRPRGPARNTTLTWVPVASAQSRLAIQLRETIVADSRTTSGPQAGPLGRLSPVHFGPTPP